MQTVFFPSHHLPVQLSREAHEFAFIKILRQHLVLKNRPVTNNIRISGWEPFDNSRTVGCKDAFLLGRFLLDGIPELLGEGGVCCLAFAINILDVLYFFSVDFDSLINTRRGA
jgi:hypothetical protein